MHGEKSRQCGVTKRKKSFSHLLVDAHARERTREAWIKEAGREEREVEWQREEERIGHDEKFLCAQERERRRRSLRERGREFTHFSILFIYLVLFSFKERYIDIMESCWMSGISEDVLTTSVPTYRLLSLRRGLITYTRSRLKAKRIIILMAVKCWLPQERTRNKKAIDSDDDLNSIDEETFMSMGNIMMNDS